MVSLSSGTSVRGSMTSTLTPSLVSVSAAVRASCTREATATTVTSVPAHLTSATPNGIRYSSSGTSPLVPQSIPSSKLITGSSSRTAVFSRPFMS